MFSLSMHGIKPLKDTKCKTALNAFIQKVNEFNRKPNKLYADQGRVFYNKLIQERLDKINILIYSTHNEGKSVMIVNIIFVI